MIKKEFIKAAFEKSVQIHSFRGWVSTYEGRKPLHSITIEIQRLGYWSDKFFVALCTNINPSYGVVQLRSYPMSYKSAHRLVCSL